jgi:hypothetical protein
VYRLWKNQRKKIFMAKHSLNNRAFPKRIAAFGIAIALASAGIISAQASTTFDVDTRAMDFNKVAPFTSAAAPLVALQRVELATTGNITLSGLQTIDGLTTPDEGEILVKNQTNPAENGIYFAQIGAWVRVLEYDESSEINAGDYVFVKSGSVNSESGWTQQNAVTALDTDPIAWSSGLFQLGGSGLVDIGEDLAPGTSVDYLDLVTVGGQAIDARVTYLGHYGVDNGTAGVLDKLDDATSSGENRFLRTDIDWDSDEDAEDRYAEFKVEFFKDLATTPVAVTLEKLNLSIYDVDNFQTVSLTGADTYLLATETILSVIRVPGTETLLVTSDDTSSSDSGGAVISSYSQGRVSFGFNEVSAFTYKLGLPKSDLSGGSSFELDFGPGVAWGIRLKDAPRTLQFSEAPTSPPISTPYSGPVPVTLEPGVVNKETITKATLTGERLSGITRGLVDGKEVVVTRATDTKLDITLPALAPGTYSIIYYSASGQITHQDSLTVRETGVELGTGTGTETGTETDTGTTPVVSRFYHAKRFSNYQGDRSNIMSADERTIRSFLNKYQGITRITCLGSTSGVPAAPSDMRLATNRANNACDIARKLNPEAKITIRAITGRGIGQFHRSVSIFVAGTNQQ